MRHLADLEAASGGGGGAADERILVGVAAGDIPIASNAAVDSDFIAKVARAAGLDDAGRIVGIGRTRIGAIEAIDGGREREVAIGVPLGAELVVGEFFRFTCCVIVVSEEN